MNTQAMPIALGEWLPDLPDSGNPGTLIAKNCIAEALDSYRSLNSLASFTDALTTACLGAFWLQGSDNNIYNFAGDTANLYRLDSDNTVWTEVNGPTGPYAALDWDFTKFGDRLIATNGADVIQKYDVGSDSAFADLAGSPPVAQRIATIRDFVVLGDTADGPNFVQWCGFNNSEIWDTPNRRAQSDSQEIPGRGGRVMRVVPGEYGVVVQEHSVSRMDYIGPSPIFQFDEVERGRGTPAANSVVWIGNKVYYYGWDGFYVFDGQSSQPISANRTADWFAAAIDVASIDTVRAVVDRRNRLVIWTGRSSSSLTYNDRMLIYNWAIKPQGRWSYAEVDTELLSEYVTSGLDLDSLDTPLSGGIDTDSINVDSQAFLGGGLNIQAFDTSHKSATFDGVPLTAQLDTREVSEDDNTRMYVNSVRPIVEGTPNTVVTVAIGKRNTLNENVSFTPARGVNDIGEANIRVNSRYQRYRLNIAGGFEHARGAKVQKRHTGGRR